VVGRKRARFKKDFAAVCTASLLAGTQKSWPGSPAAGSKWRGKLGPPKTFSRLCLKFFALRAVSPPSGSTKGGIACSVIKR
jgi:hypothetical protein